ncbi:MAG: pullulanase-type alpha-1,6-glucosidase [Chloroflexaceae bacterium]|nr:pullulanase-type alpha-1,6-glucosidase [Chloroflexaceae bacterium]
MTHIHLLPTFDIATIEEDKSKRQEPDLAQLTTFPPDSEQQQATIDPIRDKDGFNWGYDPYHYNVPEGSYSTNPDGPTRIVEFREMVQALNGAGLRVVLDVVYNHTNASGQNPRSVLDKVVPGYYHRLNGEGVVEKSTCCDNTATEHRMMEKLMVDSVLLWAKAYKVDGFRFDLMGHHMVSNMVKVREALDGLTVANDGVDGKSIYVYGEGWNFGEVQDNARGLNATQINLAGTGIGTFNDRLRDGARGGTPFGNPREQGFLTGLWEAPNGYDQGDEATQREQLLTHMDWIRVGLTGNLKTFEFTDRRGETVRGEQVIYNGQPAGYNASPVEHIVYVSAHDNETLFDAVQLKAPASASIAERVRMHNLGLSLVALSQGVPFFHAGDDLLRSKSLDRNSYNSGDWFNRIDWTGATDNWGVGLPPRGDNETHWPLMKELLGNPALKPQPADIQFAAANFREMLQIRRSSPLFRMQTAAQVQQHLSFLNTGAEQTPGLIVMRLSALGEASLNTPYEEIVVLLNGTGKPQTFTAAGLKGVPLALHPIQANGGDPVVKTASYDQASGAFSIPPRTAAVFVGTVAAPPAQPTAAPTQAAQPTAAQPTAAPAPTVAPTAVPAPAQPGAGGTSLPIVLGVVMMLVAVVVLLLRRRR